MKIKTKELSGAALDWAVATLEKEVMFTGFEAWVYLDDRAMDRSRFKPSTNWAQGGPIIERETIALDYMYSDCIGPSLASVPTDDTRAGGMPSYFVAEGETPLIAAMRCYVTSKLGDKVDVPGELIGD